MKTSKLFSSKSLQKWPRLERFIILPSSWLKCSISKNDNKSSVTLLTTTGVVNVKFTRDQYAKYGKQISEKQEDGTKKVIEKGWFKRGTKLMITGFRREDMFVAKTYKNTPTHQIYRITVVNNGLDMDLVHERINVEDGEE